LLNQIAAIHGTGTPAVTNSYESIATVLVGSGGASNIEFTSIPSTFKHLQVRAIARVSTGSPYMYVQFNGDTAANYTYHMIYATGATAAADANVNISGANAAYVSSTANTFGVLVQDVLDYADTNKFKTVRDLGGYDANGSGQVRLTSGLWRSTSAVTSLKITPSTSSFTQYSQFALYGIKG
jgi:hypothetical protein